MHILILVLNIYNKVYIAHWIFTYDLLFPIWVELIFVTFGPTQKWKIRTTWNTTPKQLLAFGDYSFDTVALTYSVHVYFNIICILY